MTAPRCRYCGAPLPKRRETRWLRTQAQADRGIGGRDWITVPELPQTLEEAQRLVNWRVTYVTRAPDGMSAQGINTIAGWDGESYDPRHGYFCKVDCAARFGRAMAERGARL